jgi:hypothetical protein
VHLYRGPGTSVGTTRVPLLTVEIETMARLLTALSDYFYSSNVLSQSYRSSLDSKTRE